MRHVGKTAWKAETLGLLLLLVLPACGRGEGARAGAPARRPDTWTVVACEGQEAPSSSHLAVGASPREARIYLDGSASMRGFAERGDRFSAVLAGLRGALLDLGVVRTQSIQVGESLRPLAHAGGFEPFDRKSFYTRSETDLGAVLDDESLPTASPLALVLTDGVMSLRYDQGRPGAILDCGRGSDVECLALKMSALVRSGRSLWILGFRSAFKGTLYSERLRVGGSRLGEVSLPDRPFYLWVIAQQAPAGRRLVERLLQRMSERPDSRRAFVVELAPGDVHGWLPDPEQAPESDSHLFPRGVSQGAVRGTFSAAAAGQPSVQQAVSQDLDGTGFGLRIPLRATPLTRLPAVITPLWTYRSGYCLRWEGRPPASVLRAQAREDGETLRLALLSPSFAALKGRRVTVTQRLTRSGGDLDLAQRFASWSTDDDRKIASGSRTLNLLGFLESLRTRLEIPEQFEQPLLRIDFK